MVARCGEVRVHHWAHKGRRYCDPWWENETQWHRAWKNQFPAHWQEFVQCAEDGERHIADVKTDDGWAIELQHSYLKPEERRSREAFYPKLAWVVNGLRRERDKARFLKTWEEGTRVRRDSTVWKVWSAEGALLRDWAGSLAHVFFDFGDEQVLWWLSPKSGDWWAYITPISRAEFIETHRRTATQGPRDFGSLVESLSRLVPNEGSNWRPQASEAIPPRNFERDFLLLGRRTLQGLQRRSRPGRYRR
jgi:hypothetical protein